MALTAIILGLHAVQAMFALTLLGLSAYLVMWFNTSTLTASPPEMNFQPFTAAFALVSIIYLELAPRKMAKATHPYILVALEGLNALFSLGGFVALVTFMMRLDFCNGLQCDVGRAASAFSGLQMFLWLGTCVLTAMTVSSSTTSGGKHNNNNGRRNGGDDDSNVKGLAISTSNSTASSALSLAPPPTKEEKKKQKQQQQKGKETEQRQLQQSPWPMKQGGNVQSGIWTK